MTRRHVPGAGGGGGGQRWFVCRMGLAGHLAGRWVSSGAGRGACGALPDVWVPHRALRARLWAHPHAHSINTCLQQDPSNSSKPCAPAAHLCSACSTHHLCRRCCRRNRHGRTDGRTDGMAGGGGRSHMPSSAACSSTRARLRTGRRWRHWRSLTAGCGEGGGERAGPCPMEPLCRHALGAVSGVCSHIVHASGAPSLRIGRLALPWACFRAPGPPQRPSFYPRCP